MFSFPSSNIGSLIAMAPKAKHAASSSKAVVPETQRGGSSMQETPISGKKKPSDLISTIKGVYRVLLTLKSLLNVNRQHRLMPVLDLQAQFFLLVDQQGVGLMTSASFIYSNLRLLVEHRVPMNLAFWIQHLEYF